MIFHNEIENIDIDLDVKEGKVTDEYTISNCAKHTTTLIGLNISDAIIILEEQGYKRMGDIDPF